MQTNIPSVRVEETFLVEEESLKDIGLGADLLDQLSPTTVMKSASVVLIDCACPTTVVGTRWIEEFIEKLSPSQRKKKKVRAKQKSL